MASCSMSRLNTAASFISNGEEKSVKVTYKTGASFTGSVQDYKKIGSGCFIWPDGSKYDGDYVNNLRHGKGVQTWADGTQYDGGFLCDLRHGEGSIQWANEETYKGSFFKDRRHGKGTYTWSNGSTFTGTFYMDKKEGYGVFYFASGSKFEGLYKDDEREGPGVLTYKDGSQDVGLWHGERLLKILTPVPNAFTMADHPQFEYYPEDMTVPVEPKPDRIQSVKNVLEPPAMFNYSPEVKVADRISELYSEDLDPRSLAVNRQAFDEEFFKDIPLSEEPEPLTLKVWNKSPMLVNIQMHIHEHRRAANSVGFNVEKVLKFDRSGFKSRGPLEQASEELIKMAAAGNFLRVEELLNSGTVHPDVADKEGHTALIGATVNWHQDTINVLLNHGADVNQLNNEGVSALAAGTIFYYPVESFHYNIAERYMEKPPAVEDCRSDISHSPTRSVLPAIGTSSPTKTERRATQLNQLNRRKSEMAALRVSKEKQEKLADSEVIAENDLEKVDEQKVVSNKPLQAPEHGSPVKVTVARDSRQDIEYIVPMKKDDDRDSVLDGGELMDEEGEETAREKEDFESNKSVHNYQIEVTDTLLERCATQLSMNERVVSRETSNFEMGRARMLAIQISQHERMKDTLELLLRRGADPNASRVPMPVLFFAIKSADVDMVRTLLMKGASTAATMSKDKGGLAPLHIAAAIPGEEGVAITELLLDALADPDIRAEEDDSFLNHNLEEEWSKDQISPESAALLGGRTPLQIACARDDNYKNACTVVQLLLKHKANPDLICNGFSPLALAITSGNDLAVDELLLYNADPSLALTHGVGNALCVSSSTDYEHRRSINGRIQLIDQLIRAGADLLAPVAIGPKRVIGTAVDYAYYKFNQDRRIAHMPYHALTHAERETYNARRRLLAHVGDILRTKAVEREKKRLAFEDERGVRSASPSQNFVFTGAGAPLPPGVKGKGAAKAGQVTFEPGAKDTKERKRADSAKSGGVRKPLFKYCYDCGRSVGVRLAACTRCKEVFYCSKACKLKAWNARHKEECIRVGGRSPSPKEGRGRKQADSPTPASHAHGDREKKNLRIHGSGDSGGRSTEGTEKERKASRDTKSTKERDEDARILERNSTQMMDAEPRRNMSKDNAKESRNKDVKSQTKQTQGKESRHQSSSLNEQRRRSSPEKILSGDLGDSAKRCGRQADQISVSPHNGGDMLRKEGEKCQQGKMERSLLFLQGGDSVRKEEEKYQQDEKERHLPFLQGGDMVRKEEKDLQGRKETSLPFIQGNSRSFRNKGSLLQKEDQHGTMTSSRLLLQHHRSTMAPRRSLSFTGQHKARLKHAVSEGLLAFVLRQNALTRFHDSGVS
ncbi:ankyrin repeat and MYND domain-containing protein 1-like isoform X2 [Littorina saxatilis]|uniref:ankyrin repeat and MYND domain-containing protein 1-like isoform X2 n=1 Tax=Littorina saxatilis TaxID=31220 RepID=UPI0038B4F2FD